MDQLDEKVSLVQKYVREGWSFLLSCRKAGIPYAGCSFSSHPIYSDPRMVEARNIAKSMKRGHSLQLKNLNDVDIDLIKRFFSDEIVVDLLKKEFGDSFYLRICRLTNEISVIGKEKSRIWKIDLFLSEAKKRLHCQHKSNL